MRSRECMVISADDGGSAYTPKLRSFRARERCAYRGVAGLAAGAVHARAVCEAGGRVDLIHPRVVQLHICIQSTLSAPGPCAWGGHYLCLPVPTVDVDEQEKADGLLSHLTPLIDTQLMVQSGMRD